MRAIDTGAVQEGRDSICDEEAIDPAEILPRPVRRRPGIGAAGAGVTCAPAFARRVHLTGASGAGVTTLGRALAQELGLPHHDTDDFYWMPTDPPFQTVRPVEDRLRLIEEMFLPRAGWVLSGSIGEWAPEVTAYVDIVVFVQTDARVRSRRLVAREEKRRRQPAEQIVVDPDFIAFHDWAMRYEAPNPPSRSRERHERWLASLDVPVVRVDGAQPLPELTAVALSAIEAASRDKVRHL